nr:MAG TPA: hypothetical protein [Caudoviricetes sp.]
MFIVYTTFRILSSINNKFFYKIYLLIVKYSLQL